MTLFEDETDLRLFPPLRNCWALRGQPTPVLLSGTNAKRVIFGIINMATGTRLFLARKRQQGEDFREFLRWVHGYYRGWHVAMILDEDASHTAYDSQVLAADLGVDLLWLPKRSPQLNPMDHLWRHGKESICANWQYASIDDEVEHFVLYLYQLTPFEALNKAGILSDDFWLQPY